MESVQTDCQRLFFASNESFYHKILILSNGNTLQALTSEVMNFSFYSTKVQSQQQTWFLYTENRCLGNISGLDSECKCDEQTDFEYYRIISEGIFSVNSNACVNPKHFWSRFKLNLECYRVNQSLGAKIKWHKLWFKSNWDVSLHTCTPRQSQATFGLTSLLLRVFQNTSCLFIGTTWFPCLFRWLVVRLRWSPNQPKEGKPLHCLGVKSSFIWHDKYEECQIETFS